MPTPARPRLYGYLRLIPGMDDHREAQLTEQLATYADAQSLTLSAVFVERRWLDVTAWDELVERCQADGVRHIVIPDPSHLSTLPIVRRAMELAVRELVGGRILVAATREAPHPPVRLRGHVR